MLHVNVLQNVNADFYATIADSSGASLPEYDVLVTNPHSQVTT
jgi:hypothetical protein